MNRSAARHGDGEPQFDQVDTAADQHPLEIRGLAHELLVLTRRAVAHHPLDARPVVPGPVEHHDLPGRRQMLHVPLEVPLRALPVRRLVQRHHAGTAQVEMLGEPLDRAALAGGIAALEHQHDLLTGVLHPALELEQLDLQPALLEFVLPPLHPLGIGIASRQVSTSLPAGRTARGRRPSPRRNSRRQVVESPLAQIDDVSRLTAVRAKPEMLRHGVIPHLCRPFHDHRRRRRPGQPPIAVMTAGASGERVAWFGTGTRVACSMSASACARSAAS